MQKIHLEKIHKLHSASKIPSIPFNEKTRFYHREKIFSEFQLFKWKRNLGDTLIFLLAWRN